MKIKDNLFVLEVSKMMKRWEAFEYRRTDDGGELHVTLNEKGEILIGAVAFERLGRPERAVLMYDHRDSLIGVLPVSAAVRDGHPLVANEGYKHRRIRANRFCRNFGIAVAGTVAFETAQIDKEGVLVLDLKNTRSARR